MTYFLYIIIFVLLGIVLYLIFGKKEKGLAGELKEIRKEMMESREKNMQSLQKQLEESGKDARENARESRKIISNVTEKLTELDRTNKQVIGFAEQLQSLENILKNPKQRGILGEYYLETVLSNVLPPQSYEMQYKFKDGKIVDAAIFVKDKIIPIDSKFSLENYNRIVEEKDPKRREELEKIFSQDLKSRIDETSKYIRPEEKTMEFALMFIPAEAIYYDLLVNQMGAIKSNTRALLEYASREKHVQIVSPNTFNVFLQMILQGLRGFKIEEAAKEIRINVEKLGRHLASYDEYMKKLGDHLSTTCNTYNVAYKELGKVDKDIVKITQREKGIEPIQIDKPNID